jgi:4-hydroxymandelate oxidase
MVLNATTPSYWISKAHQLTEHTEDNSEQVGLKNVDSIYDCEIRARQVVSAPIWADAFGTDSDTVGLNNRSNTAAFDTANLRPRVLVDISQRCLSTTILGQHIELPVLVAPVGQLRRFHLDGDLAVARASGASKTIMCASVNSSETIEDIAAATKGPIWFQMSVMKDRGLNEALIVRAETAGCTALMLTVDAAGYSSRERHSGVLEMDDTYANFDSMLGPGFVTAANWVELKSTSFTWTDLEWLRSKTSLPIVLKGVQTAEDASLCVAHGIDGLVVSNHGGHGLPGSRASFKSLPEVVEAAADHVEVLFDGGIRRGTDILKAMAMGAKAVLIGRPVAWGLATAGQDGVSAVLELLARELRTAMGLCGVTDVKDIGQRFVAL